MKENLADLVHYMISMEFITYEEMLPLIKKATSRWMKMPEGEIFKPECKHKVTFKFKDFNGYKEFCTHCDKRIK